MNLFSVSRRVALTLAVAAIASPVLASNVGTKDEAIAMVNAAVEHVKKVGPEQAFKDFSDKNNKAWQNKDLYVMAYNMAGVCVGHGANERLIGKDLSALRDPNGKELIKELAAAANKGGGWVDYEWAHPQTKKVESKTTFTRRLANFDGWVGVGVYR